MASSSPSYTAVPLSENNNEKDLSSHPRGSNVMITFGIGVLLFGSFILGVGIGRSSVRISSNPETNKLLSPQHGFIPKIPMVEKKFKFPTAYEDTGTEGDKLWNDLMPLGAGFIRVPHPRLYNLPPSQIIKGDPEEAELYSLSVTHQLHCLAVLRHVIIKYEKHDKSRFAGGGHEYHCLDYIRQSLLCASDTTLDFADDIARDANGIERHVGFTGANSTHICRDWGSIVQFVVENRGGDKIGIL